MNTRHVQGLVRDMVIIHEAGIGPMAWQDLDDAGKADLRRDPLVHLEPYEGVRPDEPYVRIGVEGVVSKAIDNDTYDDVTKTNTVTTTRNAGIRIGWNRGGAMERAEQFLDWLQLVDKVKYMRCIVGSPFIIVETIGDVTRKAFVEHEKASIDVARLDVLMRFPAVMTIGIESIDPESWNGPTVRYDGC